MHLPIEKHTLSYDARLRSWRRAGDQRTLEIIVAGDEAGPAGSKILLAESVLRDIEKFTTTAIDYAKAKLRGAEALHQAKWYLEWAEFGIGEKTELEEFELFFTEDDLHVLWSVRFRNQGQGAYPYAIIKADW